MKRSLYGFLIVSLISLSSGTELQAQEDVFRSQVRPTDPLTAEQEQQALKVPEGFTVQLFASEPDIQKPLNMAFDADGRLWVTGSSEYPYPAEEGKGQDSIRVLEDTDDDGRADRITVFADDLNIPIGIYPYQDGAVVFSIPNILFLRDTDGDGKADQREVLYGPFDTSRDTHGMNNAFRRGFDGWLYCCHGFNNRSTVAGSDGHSVEMQSGNTYRIRLDGSRIEHFGHGQVNPFGMTIDANGDLFTSDCHTKPVTLVLRDGFYESFGKPHDGLGFVPSVMNHTHGSTAIDAISQYQGTAFPRDYYDDLFVGNVMTCRVHRNSIVRNGASVRMKEEEDFLVSDDPWFRPVDTQVGPDGALYVADFYNKIIGHYEVPLDHPGRDRERGRIWRISYDKPASQTDESASLSAAGTEQLVTALGDARQGVRQHAADQLVDRIGPDAAEPVRASLDSSLKAEVQIGAPQKLWVLHRLEAVTPAELNAAFSQGNERTRIHVMRICSEQAANPEVRQLVLSGLEDSSALVRRSAADAAGQHPSSDLANAAVSALYATPEDDVHLKHSLRLALRNQMKSQTVANWFTSTSVSSEVVLAVADILPGLNTPQVPDIALAAIRSGHVATGDTPRLLKHAAQAATPDVAEELVRVATELPGKGLSTETELWKALSDGFRSRSVELPDNFRQWSQQLAQRVFDEASIDNKHWGQYSLDGSPFAEWSHEPRLPKAGTDQKIPFLSSLPGGEKATGILRSKPFVMPLIMEFKLCGHLGRPDQPPIPANRVVLRDLKSGKVVKSAFPPRNDVAEQISWSLGGYAGRVGYLEVVDGINQGAYAWLAVSDFNPPFIKTRYGASSSVTAQLNSAIEILLSQILNGDPVDDRHIEILRDLVGQWSVDGSTRTLAARVLMIHQGSLRTLPVSDVLQIGSIPTAVDAAVVAYCRGVDETADSAVADSDLRDRELLKTVFSLVGPRIRTQLVAGLANSKDSAELLVQSIESGVPSAEVLRDDRLVQQLTVHGTGIADRIKSLRDELPPQEIIPKGLITRIARRLSLGEGDVVAGEALFGKHCVACHRKHGKGGLAGPQLDGIGTRGSQRLLEDILNPNANVDIAFRTSVVVLNDGRSMTGILRDTDTPDYVQVIDTKGKQTTIPKSSIDERVDSRLSLMPGGLLKLMSEDDLVNLVRWLEK